MIEDIHEKVKSSLDELKDSALSIQQMIEQELVQNYSIIQTISDMLSEGVILCTESKEIKVINQNACTLLSVEKDKVIDTRLNSIITLDLSKYRQEILLGNSTLELVASKMTSKEETLYLLLLKDISARKIRENNILNLSIFHASLLEYIPLPLFYTDLTGSKILGSLAFYDVMPYTASYLYTKNINNIILELEEQILPNEVTTELKIATVLVSTVSGNKPSLIRRATVLDSKYKPIGYVYTLLDIGPVLGLSYSPYAIPLLSSHKIPCLVYNYSEERIEYTNVYANKYKQATFVLSTDIVDDIMAIGWSGLLDITVNDVIEQVKVCARACYSLKYRTDNLILIYEDQT